LRRRTAEGILPLVNLLGVVVTGFTLCATSACVKVPPFEHQDAPAGDGNTSDAPSDGSIDGPAVTVEQNGADINVVVATGYSMRFSTAGSRFPYQLIVGGQHLMGGSEQCNDEQAMGIAMYPVQRVNGADSTGMGAPTVTVPLTGPWVAQVRVEWATSYPCSSGTGSFVGHTTFSFFPNGRLTRFDVIESETARASADCTACAASGSPFVITSYTTLIADSGAFLSDGNEPTLDMYGEQVTNPGDTACVRQRGQTIAFSWVDTQNRLRVVNTNPSRSIAFVKDMFSGASVTQGQDIVATTQMAISSTDTCGVVENRLRPFSDGDHSIRINDTAVGAALNDGIFGGDPRTTGYPVNFPVTITPGQTILPRMPAGFAVWLYSNPIPQNLTLTHSGGHTGNWYRLQRVGTDQVVIWFEVSLEQGETITISGS
jgi:hypothetical protein